MGLTEQPDLACASRYERRLSGVLATSFGFPGRRKSKGPNLGFGTVEGKCDRAKFDRQGRSLLERDTVWYLIHQIKESDQCCSNTVCEPLQRDMPVWRSTV